MSTQSVIRTRSVKAASDLVRIALNSNFPKEPGEIFGVRQHHPNQSILFSSGGDPTLYILLPLSVSWTEVQEYVKSLGVHHHDRPYDFVLIRK